MPKHKSRQTRLNESIGPIDDVISDVEELKDELQEWLDNMPENLQGGQKAEELEAAISELEQVADYLEEAKQAADDVSFPGMF